MWINQLLMEISSTTRMGHYDKRDRTSEVVDLLGVTTLHGTWIDLMQKYKLLALDVCH